MRPGISATFNRTVSLYSTTPILGKRVVKGYAAISGWAFDKAFNIPYFKKKLNNKSKNIKNYLIDQKFVSGIGNIYASEILFYSKINPLKKSGKLSLKDFKKLIFFSQKVLKNAISKGGSTIQNFKSSYGELGSFQKHFKVYDREGKKCLKKRCEGIVKKKVISNRSSFYCNICQKI